MGKVKFGKLKNPTMKDVVIAEFRNQFDIGDKPPTPKNLFDHLKLLYAQERYKRTNPGKKQIPTISYFENDTIKKLSADDEEKEKDVETKIVKGGRKRKRGMDTYDKIKNKGVGHLYQGYRKYKSEEIFDAIDEWRFRLKHYGDKYNKELNEDKAARAEKRENEEKRTQSQKMMVSHFDTTQFRFSDSMLEDVITEVKKVEGQNNNEGVEIVDDVIKNVAKAGKLPASIGFVLSDIETAGKDEKPAKGKGREGNEEKPAQVKKVKEVDAGEGKVNEQKVVEDDAGYSYFKMQRVQVFQEFVWNLFIQMSIYMLMPLLVGL
ncbi:hypothetical protein L1987_57721 [Smallanthus sonchifolius]|uniref:Uncharacterized protein n=1 Tax=Smallanthus sonchifolius TaxID=185202 RepID=A0ACB9DE36_9ASTR|nr:hypothetical protein L1987_57721 [Smallanthus sonchifolius]